MDIRIPGKKQRVYACDIKDREKYCRSRQNIDSRLIVDFYCPECRLPVQFISGRRGGTTPHFKHGRVEDRNAAECACSRYYDSKEIRAWIPEDAYSRSGGIPLYLAGKKDLFTLRAFFPTITPETFHKLEELEAVICIIPKGYTGMRNEIRLSIRRFGAIGSRIFCEIHGAFSNGYRIEMRNGKDNLLQFLPQEVNLKWGCGIDGIKSVGNIFHSWRDGGMRVAPRSDVHVGKWYRLLKKDTEDYNGLRVEGIEFRKAGTMHLDDGMGPKVWAVWDIRATEATGAAKNFFLVRECILVHKPPSLTPIWPPGVWQGRELIFAAERAYFAYEYGTDNGESPNVFVAEDNALIHANVLRVNNNYAIANVTVDKSKPIIIGGKITPMCFDMRKDNNIFRASIIQNELKIEDKNNNDLFLSQNKLPQDSILFVKSKMPVYSRIERNSFVLDSFGKDKIEGVRWETTVAIDAGRWGEHKIEFVKVCSAVESISLAGFDKQLLACGGGRFLPTSTWLIRLAHKTAMSNDKDADQLYQIIRRWIMTASMPVSALPILLKLEKLIMGADNNG